MIMEGCEIRVIEIITWGATVSVDDWSHTHRIFKGAVCASIVFW